MSRRPWVPLVVLLASAAMGATAGAVAGARESRTLPVLETNAAVDEPSTGGDETTTSGAAGPAVIDSLVFIGVDRTATEDLWDVYLIDPDGTPVNLTNSSDDEFAAARSPDGTRIAYVADYLGDRQIFVMNADGSGVRRLTSGPGSAEDPAWSPDGTHIAYSHAFPAVEAEGYLLPDIWVMADDGTEQRALTVDDIDDRLPAWSPGGDQIVFSRATDATGFGVSKLFVMSSSGGTATQLTAGDGFDGRSDWSPDGSTIAFTRFFDEGERTLLVNADGTNERELVPGSTDFSLYPTWSPDGSEVLYVAMTEALATVYAVDPNGDEPRLVVEFGIIQDLSW